MGSGKVLKSVSLTSARLCTVALAALALPLLASCNSSSGGAGTATSVAMATPPASASGDAALAEAMLMVKDDLPFDWHAAPHPTNNDEAILSAACGRTSALGITARATSVEYLFDGQSPGIMEVLSMFDSEADARASVDGATAFIDCAITQINGGAIDTAEQRYSGAMSSPVAVASGGQGSAAFEISATVSFTSSSGRATAAYTFVFGSKGRVEYEIFVRGSGEAFDPDELSDYVQAATSHISLQ